ncbi:MAG: acylphosphatase, partial [Candidatus Bipolaricaulia bacterium]
MIRRRVLVNGIVQGVGFRPFVYRIAVQNKLVGSVRNLGDAGVEIIVEGGEEQIARFLEDLKAKRPPLAAIEHLKVEELPADGRLAEFRIERSSSGGRGSGTIPPDVAICEECLE